jgi:hypothetical protein
MPAYIKAVTPFPYLANIIRQSSTPDACRIFKAIGELACKDFALN